MPFFDAAAALPFGAAVALPFDAAVALPFDAAVALPFGAAVVLPFGAAVALPALLFAGADFGAAALRAELFALELFAVALEGLDLGTGRFFVAMGPALYVVFARTRMPILRVFELYRVFGETASRATTQR